MGRFVNTEKETTGSNQKWEQAAAFLNIYFPRKNGERHKKLGAIKLMASDEETKSLVEWLQKDEANLQKFMDRLIVEFNVNASASGNAELDLD